MTPALRNLLTEDEAADLLRISARTLRAIRAAGKIRYVRQSPRKVLYAPEDIAEYIARASQQESPPCPSTSQRKARAATTTSSSGGNGIMGRLAARPGLSRNLTPAQLATVAAVFWFTSIGAGLLALWYWHRNTRLPGKQENHP